MTAIAMQAQHTRNEVVTDPGEGLQELARRAWAHLKDTGESPLASAGATVTGEDIAALDEEDVLYAIQRAVAYLVNDEKRQQLRRAMKPEAGRSAERVEKAVAKMEAQVSHALAILAVMKEGADGQQRELGDMTAEDHQFRAAYERSVSVAATARRRWHEDVAAELQRAGVDSVRKLPLSMQTDLARKYRDG